MHVGLFYNKHILIHFIYSLGWNLFTLLWLETCGWFLFVFDDLRGRAAGFLALDPEVTEPTPDVDI